MPCFFRFNVLGIYILLAQPLSAEGVVYASVDEFVKAVVPAGADIITIEKDSSDVTGDGIEDTFGIVQYRSPDTEKDSGLYKNILFVLNGNPKGKFSLDAMSKAFDYGGGNGTSYIEGVEPLNRQNFYVQFNSATVCGTFVDRFTFKAVNGQWRLVGKDESDSVCNDDYPDVGVTPSYSKSFNYLTNEYTVDHYRAGKVIKSERNSKAFPVYPLESFDPLETTYGD